MEAQSGEQRTKWRQGEERSDEIRDRDYILTNVATAEAVSREVVCPLENGNERTPKVAIVGEVDINFEVVLVGHCQPRNGSIGSTPSYMKTSAVMLLCSASAACH